MPAESICQKYLADAALGRIAPSAGRAERKFSAVSSLIPVFGVILALAQPLACLGRGSCSGFDDGGFVVVRQRDCNKS